MTDQFTAPDLDGLNELTLKARRQVELEMLIDNAEELVATLKREHLRLSGTEIPTLMQKLGVAEVKLTDGSRVTVTPFYAGKITSDAGYNWLKDSGNGDIVKAAFELPYDFTMSPEDINEIKRRLDQTGLGYTEKKSVHHMTLGAFIKEQELAGTPVPHDLFNVYSGFKTKIK